MSESPADMLARVQMMAQGDPKWDLSDNDQAALQYLVNSITGLRRQLAESEARREKLHRWAMGVLEAAQKAGLAFSEADGFDQMPELMVQARDEQLDDLKRELAEARQRIETLEGALRRAVQDIRLTQAVTGNSRIADYLEAALTGERPDPRRVAMERVIQAAKGFREHGAAKHGTHGEILFKALDALAALEGEAPHETT